MKHLYSKRGRRGDRGHGQRQLDAVNSIGLPWIVDWERIGISS